MLIGILWFFFASQSKKLQWSYFLFVAKHLFSKSLIFHAFLPVFYAPSCDTVGSTKTSKMTEGNFPIFYNLSLLLLSCFFLFAVGFHVKLSCPPQTVLNLGFAVPAGSLQFSDVRLLDLYGCFWCFLVYGYSLFLDCLIFLMSFTMELFSLV